VLQSINTLDFTEEGNPLSTLNDVGNEQLHKHVGFLLKISFLI
jgi:hypothetical protein